MKNKYDDLIKIMRKQSERLSKSPSDALDFLIKAGIYTKSGRLKRKYR